MRRTYGNRLKSSYEQGARAGWSLGRNFEADIREETKSYTRYSQPVPGAGAFPGNMEGDQICSFRKG